METRKSLIKNPLVIAAVASVLAFAVACGDDDDTSNPAPTGGSKATGGTSSTAGKSTGGSSTAGKSSGAGTSNEPATGGGGAGAGAGGVAGEGGMGGAAPDCTDETDMGCFKASVCKPKTLDNFLNACPTTGCEAFPNGDLTSLKNGKLPDLP